MGIGHFRVRSQVAATTPVQSNKTTFGVRAGRRVSGTASDGILSGTPTVLAGCNRRTDRRAAKIDAALTGVNHDEHLWERLYEVQAQGEQQNGAHGASSCFAANQIETGLLAQPRFKHIPIQFNAYWTFLDLRRKTSNACNSMIALVAGGGFEPPTFGL